MDRMWERIEAWLVANAPAVAAGLNPPASAEVIADTERFLGVTLLDDVRASYLRHDGQRFDSPWMFEREWLCLDRIREELKVWKDLLDGGDFDGSRATLTAESCVRTGGRTAWIPLTYSGSGDHHCLDLAPGRRGVSGQIIEMWHDDCARPVVAHSFGEWLADFANRLEAGVFVVSDEYGGLCRREDV